MRLPRSPLAVFATLCAVIIPAAAGLTAPVWLMVMGVKLDRAAGIGADIVGVTVLACVALAGAYWVFLRPRIEAARPLVAGAYADEDTTLRDRVIHTVVWMLFVVPFVLVIIGFIMGQLDKVSVE
ncbi:MAG: hypothetical protein Q7R40_08650 [Phaeospirillum sp.]|nr:hypothetical protein [Phaeospirillum sp.]